MISCNWTVGGKIPVVAGTDAEVYLACARTAGIRDLSQCRSVRVVNTLKVGEAWVSPPVLKELQDRADIEVLEGGLAAFDEGTGDLLPFEGPPCETSWFRQGWKRPYRWRPQDLKVRTRSVVQATLRPARMWSARLSELESDVMLGSGAIVEKKGSVNHIKFFRD